METIYTLSDILAVVCPLALGVMGAIFAPTRSSRTRRNRRIAFGVIGVVGVVASIFTVISAHREQVRLTGAVTGGDSFAVLKADILSNKDGPKLILFSITNQGDYTLRNVIVAVSPASSPLFGMPGYASTGIARFNVLPAHEGFTTGIVIQPGDYAINVTADNGTIAETITVEMVGDVLNQSGRVTRGGKEIYSFR